MSPQRVPAALLTALCLLHFSGATAPAQMQPHARFEGELLPIVTCAKERVYVRHGTQTRRSFDFEYRLRPAPDFGDGFVEITGVSSDLDALRDAPAKDRAKPSAIRFRYRATLTADRSLADCYGLLTFVTQGSVGTHLVPIDRLTAGKPKTVEIELRHQIESVGSLHIFADTRELRTTQHGGPYDAKAYLEGLARSAAVSATEILKADNEYAHALTDDGRMLATVREREARKQLVVYDLADMKLRVEIPVVNLDDFVGELTWISDHELAYITHEYPRKGLPEYKLSLLDIQTRKTRLLREDVHDIILAVPDRTDELVIFAGDYRKGYALENYDIRTGRLSNVHEPDSGVYYFDRAGRSRVRIRYDDDLIDVSCRPTPDARWRPIDDLVKQPRLRFNVRGEGLLDRVVDVHSVGPDGDTLYISSRLGSDRFELAAFSMSEGVVKQVIARHPKYDLSTGDGGRTRLLFARKSTRLLGLLYEAQKLQVLWLDPAYAAVQQAMDAAFPEHMNVPIDWSVDGQTFIYLSSNDRDPGTYYVFQPAKSQLIPLFRRGERLAGRTLAKMEPFEFTSRDGQKIPGYVTRPAQPADGLRPLLVRIHGGPTERDRWGFHPDDQFFAARGYVVLHVNYRGSSGYGAAFQKAGLRARLDTVVLDDIADGTRALIAQGGIDPARVAVSGGSFGGWATYLCLIKYPDLYRAGIAMSAISNWRRSLHYSRWVFDNKLSYAFWHSLLNHENFAATEKFIDPLLRVAEIKRPVLLIHGERDEVIHPTEARAMLEALQKHHATVEALSLPFSNHSHGTFSERVIALNEMATFLGKHLGRPASEPAAVAAAAAGPHP